MPKIKDSKIFISIPKFRFSLLPGLIWQLSKTELLQLIDTQFPSLAIFVSEKVEIEKTKTTFIISVLKVAKVSIITGVALKKE